MGTTVGQSHSSPAVDRPISAMANSTKPIGSSTTNPHILVLRRKSPISSPAEAPNVSANQLLTAESDAPKVIKVPIASLQNRTRISNADGTTQFSVAKNAGVKAVWPQNMASGLSPVKQITPHNNSQNAQPIAVKRTVAPSPGNQVTAKVIITNNSSNQSVTPVSVSANVNRTSSLQSLLSSPTITSRNMVNVAGTQQIMNTAMPIVAPSLGNQVITKVIITDNFSNQSVTPFFVPANVSGAVSSQSLLLSSPMITSGNMVNFVGTQQIMKTTMPIVTPSLGNQVITKVIITDNFSNQSVTPVSVPANVSGTGSLQTPLLSSPTITSRNMMSFTGTQQIMKTTMPTVAPSLGNQVINTNNSNQSVTPVSMPANVSGTCSSQSLLSSPMITSWNMVNFAGTQQIMKTTMPIIAPSLGNPVITKVIITDNFSNQSVTPVSVPANVSVNGSSQSLLLSSPTIASRNAVSFAGTQQTMKTTMPTVAPSLGNQVINTNNSNQSVTPVSMPANVSGTSSSQSLLSSPMVTSENMMNFAGTQQLMKTTMPIVAPQLENQVIITNNSSNQSLTCVPVPPNVTGTGPSQSLLLPSPTITLSRNMVNFAGAQQIMKPTMPTMQGVYLLSPVTPLSKITTVPSSLMKSPRRIAPATSTFTSTVTSKSSTVTGSVATSSPTIKKTITVPQSLKKSLLQTARENLASALASTPVTPSHVQSSGMGTQQLQEGNNIHIIRLGAPDSSTTKTTVANKQASFLPSTTTTAVVSSLPTITATSQMCKTAVLAKQDVKIKPEQKILIPAPMSSSQGGTSGSLTSSQVGQFASGTSIPIVGSGQGYFIVPANYMTQEQQAPRSVQNAPVLVRNILPAPIMSTSSSIISGASQSGTATSANTSGNFLLTSGTNQAISHHMSKNMNSRVLAEAADNRPRKPCNCTRSQCLKLYCDCFASGKFCNGCNCYNCYNNLTHKEECQKAAKSCLDRDRMAFYPKIRKSPKGDTELRHIKGCQCKRSECLKNYCDCYEAKILCTDICKCIGCKNFEDSHEWETLMDNILRMPLKSVSNNKLQ